MDGHVVVGVSWSCFTHGAPCRPVVFFRNPLGGPLTRVPVGCPLAYRAGDSFRDLTLEEPVDLGLCFSGALAGGLFWEVLHA